MAEDKKIDNKPLIEEHVMKPEKAHRLKRFFYIHRLSLLINLLCLLLGAGLIILIQYIGIESKKTTKANSYISIYKNESPSKTDDSQKRYDLEKATYIFVGSMVKVRVYLGNGQLPENYDRITTGVIIKKSANIYILTDAETLSGYTSVQVEFSNGSQLRAQVKKRDTNFDIAILSVQGNAIDYSTNSVITEVTFGNSGLFTVEDGLIFSGMDANGNTYNAFGSGTGTSTIDVLDGGVTAITTNISNVASDNGFLFNKSGELIGVVNHAKDLGFSNYVGIEINDLEQTIEKMMNGMDRAYLGVYGKTIPEGMKSDDGVEIPEGVYITDIEKDSPIYLAGLHIGDVIIKVGRSSIYSTGDLREILDATGSGETITLTFKRRSAGKYESFEAEMTLD